MITAIALFVFLLLLFIVGWGLTRFYKNGSLSKTGRFFQGVAVALLLFELLAALVLRMHNGKWVYALPYNQNEKLFSNHPYLVGVNQKEIKETFGNIVFTHNSKGFRGAEWGAKKNGSLRVVAIGGSTTYGVGVNDWETWPYYLDSLAGSGVEVLNLGIPGHSTVEHIIFAALQLKEIDPDVVLIHAGLNDLRNGHVPELAVDYTNFHAPSLKSSLGLCPDEQLPRIAVLRLVVRCMQVLNWYPECNLSSKLMESPVVAATDERVVHHFRRNLNTLVDLFHSEGTKVVLVPQVLAQDAFRDGNYRWWAPFLADEAIFPFQQELNHVMRTIASQRCCGYPEVLDTVSWEVADFTDPSHLNAEGNLRFATYLKNWVASDAFHSVSGKECDTDSILP